MLSKHSLIFLKVQRQLKIRDCSTSVSLSLGGHCSEHVDCPHRPDAVTLHPIAEQTKSGIRCIWSVESLGVERSRDAPQHFWNMKRSIEYTEFISGRSSASLTDFSSSSDTHENTVQNFCESIRFKRVSTHCSLKWTYYFIRKKNLSHNFEDTNTNIIVYKYMNAK